MAQSAPHPTDFEQSLARLESKTARRISRAGDSRVSFRLSPPDPFFPSTAWRTGARRLGFFDPRTLWTPRTRQSR
jgi:hypothetical protein